MNVKSSFFQIGCSYDCKGDRNISVKMATQFLLERAEDETTLDVILISYLAEVDIFAVEGR